MFSSISPSSALHIYFTTKDPKTTLHLLDMVRVIPYGKNNASCLPIRCSGLVCPPNGWYVIVVYVDGGVTHLVFIQVVFCLSNIYFPKLFRVSAHLLHIYFTTKDLETKYITFI